MIESFFQKRPKLTIILAMVLGMAGLIAVPKVPMADYPELSPPRVLVQATYSGASPQVIAETVATPIEDQINGVDNVRQMSSSSYDTGTYSLEVLFEPWTDPDMDLVNVQNALKLAEPKLPSEVTQVGLTVAKVPSDYVLRFGFVTDGTHMDGYALGNFVTKEVKDALQRVPGVSNVTVSDREYAMRVWVDPLKMDALGISVFDVKTAIAQQNIQPAAGFIGNAMSSPYLSYKIDVRGRLASPDEFERIVVRTDVKTGARVLLRDVARCELGAKTYSNEPHLDGEIVYLTCAYVDPKANSRAVTVACKEAMADLEKRLPEGVKMVCCFDKSIFTDALLGRIGRAGLLGVLVALLVVAALFRSWRFAFVSATAYPLALLGTAVFFPLSGFTLDAFTALAAFCACGAILFNGLAATRRNAGGSIVAVAFVYAACLLPLALHGGVVGMMYVRFSVTLVVAVAVSSLVAVSFSSVLAHRLSLDGEATFHKTGCTCFMTSLARIPARCSPLAAVALLLLAAGLVLLAGPRIVKGFMPHEDRGYLKAEVELSEGSSMKRTSAVVARMKEALDGTPGVEHLLTSVCSSVLGKTGENHAEAYFTLVPPDERPGLTIEMIRDEIERRLEPITTAEFTLMELAPINGMGGYGGVAVFPCAYSACDPAEMEAEMNAYAERLGKLPSVHNVITTFAASTPKLYFDVDREKAYALGIPAATIFSTMQNKLASFYVNDFNIAGGSHQVVVQNGFEDRAALSDAFDLRFPGAEGAMVPLPALGSFRYVLGPRVIPRFNKLMQGGLVVAPAEGHSTLEIVEAIEKDPPDPQKYKLEWSPMTAEEISTRGRLGGLIGLSVLFVYLALVARFESWRLPFACLLPSALSVGCALSVLAFTRTPLTVYAQLALLCSLAFAVGQSAYVVERIRLAIRSGMDWEAAACAGIREAYGVVFVSGLAFACLLATAWLFRGVGANTLHALAQPLLVGVLVQTLVGVVFVPALVKPVYGAGHGRGMARERPVLFSVRKVNTDDKKKNG